MALDPAQVSAEPQVTARRRTLHPGPAGPADPELAQQPAVYAYSFILTNLDVSAPDKAVAAEHWYRHRTTVENIFRDSKLGAALRHLPSGTRSIPRGMWGALLRRDHGRLVAPSSPPRPSARTSSTGTASRGGKAMIATLSAGG